ncbi:thioredoxin [Candidatus Pacearchaeota archaeon]|nr:thioredoxin [Candidatus Pacearchaeota archaeon]
MAVVHLNQKNFTDEILTDQGLTIVDFWASWCGPCQLMGPVFEELSEEYKGKIKFAKLSTEEEPALASQFKIQGIPSLVVLKGGKEINRIVGFAPRPVLKQKIDSVLENI